MADAGKCPQGLHHAADAAPIHGPVQQEDVGLRLRGICEPVMDAHARGPGVDQPGGQAYGDKDGALLSSCYADAIAPFRVATLPNVGLHIHRIHHACSSFSAAILPHALPFDSSFRASGDTSAEPSTHRPWDVLCTHCTLARFECMCKAMASCTGVTSLPPYPDTFKLALGDF